MRVASPWPDHRLQLDQTTGAAGLASTTSHVTEQPGRIAVTDLTQIDTAGKGTSEVWKQAAEVDTHGRLVVDHGQRLAGLGLLVVDRQHLHGQSMPGDESAGHRLDLGPPSPFGLGASDIISRRLTRALGDA